MKPQISNAFMAFTQESPGHAKAWADMVSAVSQTNILDKKTTALIYVGILAALGLESGIPYHVNLAKEAGATKKEIIHAILVGLPSAGHKVTQTLPIVVESYGE